MPKKYIVELISILANHHNPESLLCNELRFYENEDVFKVVEAYACIEFDDRFPMFYKDEWMPPREIDRWKSFLYWDVVRTWEAIDNIANDRWVK